MIKLVGLFPRHLNLNGDFGNLTVLSKQLEWRGVEFEVHLAESLHEIPVDASFILLGHGSAAAWADLSSYFSELKKVLGSALERGAKILAVSSGVEHLFDVTSADSAGIGLLPGKPVLRERTSEFKSFVSDSKQSLGYVNSELELPLFSEDGGLICTLLHGPFLAKSEYLQELVSDLCAYAGVECPELSHAKTQELKKYLEGAWVAAGVH